MLATGLPFVQVLLFQMILVMVMHIGCEIVVSQAKRIYQSFENHETRRSTPSYP